MKIDDIVKTIVIYLFGFGGIGFLWFIFFFLNPEIFEKWAAIFWKIICKIWKGWQTAEKKFIAFDVQGRINEFSRRIKSDVSGYDALGVKLVWVGETDSEDSFVQDGALVLRMRKSEDENKNFIVASLLFVSQVIIRKAKHYISPIQKESIDLFVTNLLLEKEKREILQRFIEDYLLVRTEEDNRIRSYFDNYRIIDKVGIFFPMFIEELAFLGSKVFGKKRDAQIIAEVNQLIDFLKKFSERGLKEEIPLTFTGQFFRIAIVITTTAEKRSRGNIAPILRYIENLVRDGIESIYLIGPSLTTNVSFMHMLKVEIEKKWEFETSKEKKYTAFIKAGDRRIPAPTYLILLRSRAIKFLIDSEELH
jgi:hypothetical protein